MEYFRQRPLMDLSHGPVVDWVEEQYVALYGRKPRDPWRAIRKLYELGQLIQVRKGVYRYDPAYTASAVQSDFPPETREAIFARDGHKCVICGRGRADGVELCADHIRPKSRGGDDSLDNGQTLCTEHNLLKKNYSQTEAGKRFFIRMYRQAVQRGDDRVVAFCKDVLDTYDRHGLDAHIARPDL